MVFDSPAQLARQIAVFGVNPALNVVIPAIGSLAEMSRYFRLSDSVGKISGREQARDFNRQGEWRISGIFFPPVLLRNRSIADDVGRGTAD